MMELILVKSMSNENDDYPDDLTLHVRDPQIIGCGDHYYMILGARTIKMLVKSHYIDDDLLTTN